MAFCLVVVVVVIDVRVRRAKGHGRDVVRMSATQRRVQGAMRRV
jgi:hypothetical protein